MPRRPATSRSKCRRSSRAPRSGAGTRSRVRAGRHQLAARAAMARLAASLALLPRLLLPILALLPLLWRVCREAACESCASFARAARGATCFSNTAMRRSCSAMRAACSATIASFAASSAQQTTSWQEATRSPVVQLRITAAGSCNGLLGGRLEEGCKRPCYRASPICSPSTLKRVGLGDEKSACRGYSRARRLQIILSSSSPLADMPPSRRIPSR